MKTTVNIPKKNSTLLKWAFKAVVALIIIVTTATTGFSQNGVRIAATSGTADASAMLEVLSVTKGFLAPRMTAAQRGAIGSPATGLMVYQTDGTDGYYYYDGSSWIRISTTTGTVTGVTASSPLFSTGGANPDISLTGIVGVANGGSGAGSLTGYLVGNGASPFTGTATIPTSDLSGTVSNGQLANSSVTVNAGTGLTGGGTVALGSSTTIDMGNTAVSAGSYGSSTSVGTFTVDAQGRLTSAGNTAISASGIGAITAETDPQVSNTTANYVPKWNGATLIDGTMYDNGNIGIGTNAPADFVHVRKDQNAPTYVDVQNATSGTNSYVAFFAQSNTGGGTALQTFSSGFTTSGVSVANSGRVRTDIPLTTGLYLGSGASAPVVFFTNDAEKARFDASGNFGIGTNTPAQKLDVSGGDINVSTGQGFRINNTAASGTYLRGNGTRYVSSSILAADIPAGAVTASNGLTISSGNNVTLGGANALTGATTIVSAGNALRFDGGGNFGINKTAAPGAKFEVDQTTATALARFYNYANPVNIEFRRTAGSQASPTATGANSILGRLFGMGYDGSTYQNAAAISMETEGSTVTSANAPGRIVFSTTPTGTVTLAERMRIDNAGNVGIGTTAPAATLSIGTAATNKLNITGAEGDITFTDPLGTVTFPATAGANSPMIQMFASGTTNADRMVIAHSSGFLNWGLQYQDASDKFNFLSAGTGVMTVDLTAQNVGIANTAPDERLVVGNSASAVTESMKVISNVDAGINIIADPLNASGNEDANPYLYLQQDGTSVSGILGFAGATNVEPKAGAAYTGWINNGMLLGTNTAFPLQLGTNANARLTILSNGNVGIGTTAPSVKLDVVGTTSSNSIIAGTNTSTSTGVPVIGVYGASYNNSTVFNNSSGVMGVGGEYGVMGLATPGAPALAGGYFQENFATIFARVAYWTGYKIIGAGLVSTTKLTRSKGRVTLHATESPEAWFEDMGIAHLVNGHVTVNIDPTFMECIIADESHPYLVFVTPQGDVQNQLVVKKSNNSFEIVESNGGTSNCEVAWRMLGKWRDAEDLRFEEAPGPVPTNEDPEGIADIISQGFNPSEIPHRSVNEFEKEMKAKMPAKFEQHRMRNRNSR